MKLKLRTLLAILAVGLFLPGCIAVDDEQSRLPDQESTFWCIMMYRDWKVTIEPSKSKDAVELYRRLAPRKFSRAPPMYYGEAPDCSFSFYSPSGKKPEGVVLYSIMFFFTSRVSVLTKNDGKLTLDDYNDTLVREVVGRYLEGIPDARKPRRRDYYTARTDSANQQLKQQAGRLIVPQLSANRDSLDCELKVSLPEGQQLVFRLIPSVKFTMGSPMVVQPAVRSEVWLSSVVISFAVLCFLIYRLFKNRFRYSLRQLLLVTFLSGGCLGSLFSFLKARAEWSDYRAATFYPFYDHESPHEVFITRPFYVGETEVTQEQYSAVMYENPSHFKGASRPVDRVSYQDAVRFCERVSEVSGLVCRLPTEAEWEWAAGGGGQTLFVSGNQEKDLDFVSWYSGNSAGATHPVKRKMSNRFGLYDVHGNVAEWCSDYYDIAYYGNSEYVDPKGARSGATRVVRGGGWNDRPYFQRISMRGAATPNVRSSAIGFRVVVNVKPVVAQ